VPAGPAGRNDARLRVGEFRRSALIADRARRASRKKKTEPDGEAQVERQVRDKVQALCARLPLTRDFEKRQARGQDKRGEKMRCPFCGHEDTKLRTRDRNDEQFGDSARRGQRGATVRRADRASPLSNACSARRAEVVGEEERASAFAFDATSSPLDLRGLPQAAGDPERVVEGW